MNTNKTQSHQQPQSENAWHIFLIFLRLGLTSFGGPVAHLGFFRDEFVSKRKWLSEQSYADVVSLCQFLPGPASSQVGMVLGYFKGGYKGVVAAWCGFTLPSAIALILLAHAIQTQSQLISPELIHGLKLVAVAVIAQAVWGMAKSLCPDPIRITIMMLSTCAVLLTPVYVWAQVGVITAAAVFGAIYFKASNVTPRDPLPIHMRRSVGGIWMSLFLALLVLLPLLSATYPSQTLSLISSFYSAGSLVFGGGHVVLPLLQSQVVPAGWLSNESFLAGYGLTQAMPGPLFTFAAYLGASSALAPNGWMGGSICLLAIFAPSFFLVMGAMPFWETIRHNARVQAALMSVNASVVGILLSALYQPVWTSSVLKPTDFAVALIALIALTSWKVSPWKVVCATAAISPLVSMLM